MKAIGLSITSSLCLAASAYAVPPTVSNIRASQQPGTKLVDILYDVADPDSASLTVQVEMSADSGVNYDHSRAKRSERPDFQRK
jgi:hypothetical protein